MYFKSSEVITNWHFELEFKGDCITSCYQLFQSINKIFDPVGALEIRRVALQETNSIYSLELILLKMIEPYKCIWIGSMKNFYIYRLFLRVVISYHAVRIMIIRLAGFKLNKLEISWLKTIGYTNNRVHENQMHCKNCQHWIVKHELIRIHSKHSNKFLPVRILKTHAD